MKIVKWYPALGVLGHDQNITAAAAGKSPVCMRKNAMNVKDVLKSLGANDRLPVSIVRALVAPAAPIESPAAKGRRKDVSFSFPNPSFRCVSHPFLAT